MNSELVRVTTEEVGRGIPITDTVCLVNWLNLCDDGKMLIRGDKGFIQLSNINNLIKKYKESFDMFGNETFLEKVLNQNTGNNVNGYILNEQQATFLITLLDNMNVKVLKLKIKLVKDFFIMRRELLARAETRAIGKMVRKDMTKALKDNLEEGTNFKKFAYSNYTKLVYKKLFGKTVKKIKEDRGLNKKDNIRDFFTLVEIEKVQDLESKIATFIEFTNTKDKDDKEIYQLVKKYIESSIE